jgi:hypothetical protein
MTVYVFEGSDREFSIPTALEPYGNQKIWVVWRWVKGKDGKPTKMPYQPHDSRRQAKSNEPETWSDLDTAIETTESDGFSGIGLELHEGEIGAIDIDHCRDKDTGVIHDKVLDLIKRFNTYTEVTPSKTGLRIIGHHLEDPKEGRKFPLPGADGVSIELYPACKRFITVTGDHLDDTPETLADITDAMNALIDELSKVKKSGNGRAKDDHPAEDDDDELPASLTTRLFIPNEGAGKPHAGYATRSELMFAFISDALRGRIAAKRIVTACLDEAHRGCAIYQHCIEKGGKSYVERQIEQARAKIKADLDDAIAKINEDHALVLAGNKAVVMKFEKVKGRSTFRLLQVGAFKQWFANQQVTVGKKVISIAEYWLSHGQRRQFHGIEFNPAKTRDGYYNLWQGFTVEPKEGDCSKFLAHLKDNIARGDEQHFKWIVAWWAQIVQQPTVKPGSSLVVRGKQGTGKTFMGKMLRSLFGEHYELVDDQRYVTGQFNSHMASLLVLHADEAFWAGDRRAEGKLKGLVTEIEHMLEFKGIEPMRMDNYIRLFVTANHDWVVPAGFDERRFAVFDISEEHIRDYRYFAAIENEWNKGGKEAMLDYPLKYDISQINLREIPRTKALFEQIVATATAEQAWWFDTLVSGVLPFGLTELNICPKRTLYRRYVRHAKIQGVARRAIETRIGMFLNKYVGPELKDRKQKYFVVDRYGTKREEYGSVYMFPALKDCRDRFAKELGQEVSWNDPEEEWRFEEIRQAEQNDEPL